MNHYESDIITVTVVVVIVVVCLISNWWKMIKENLLDLFPNVFGRYESDFMFVFGISIMIACLFMTVCCGFNPK
jgi:hypothetical protein